MTDLIDRQAAIGAIRMLYPGMPFIPWNRQEWREQYWQYMEAEQALERLPSAQPESCRGCKHLGQWENEVEYGYPSPCTGCERRAEDHYER